MLVRHKHSDDRNVIVFKGEHDFLTRADRTVRRALIARREKASSYRGAGGLTDPRADLLRSNVTEIDEADVVNIHKTEHFADIPALFHSLPPDKPVVITIHDLSPITGGCDYPGECSRFSESCGRCPKLVSDTPNDLSQEIFLLKKAAYSVRSADSFAFAADSTWTAEMAQKSALASGHRVETIHYGIDDGNYNPALRIQAREALGISHDDEVICFAAHDVRAPHKGGLQLADALSAITRRRPIHLLTMGSGHFRAPEQFHHRHFGKIESDELQAVIYRAADVFVIPSLEEAFGQTALEAASCGTVIAGFDVGGVCDIVQTGLNGRLVPRGDSAALSQAIIGLLDDTVLRQAWANRTPEWVAGNFSYQRNAEAYASLYADLIRGFRS
jgi:glycosyltransferase involved in cell wall biosynthesis